MNCKKRILIAPLNWGLGHATRCIPVINALIEQNFEPVIASDGAALELLKKEFPELIAVALPSYNISYPKHGFLLKWHFLIKLAKLFKIIEKEKQALQHIVETHKISGIISDNRFGILSTNPKIPSVYITHQLQVLSGFTTWITSRLHQKIIKKYDGCWIPDFKNESNLSGKLGHLKSSEINLKYLGPLSRFSEKAKHNSVYDIMVLLSGPEPQRTLLEEKILSELKNYKGNIIVVQGLVNNNQKIIKHNKRTTIYNFMTSVELEASILKSNVIVSRSGYTSIMDFTILEKHVFFIPTPGQNEQQYLAKRIDALNIAPFCKQQDFCLDQLKRMENYTGFTSLKKDINHQDLFGLFKGE